MTSRPHKIAPPAAGLLPPPSPETPAGPPTRGATLREEEANALDASRCPSVSADARARPQCSRSFLAHWRNSEPTSKITPERSLTTGSGAAVANAFRPDLSNRRSISSLRSDQLWWPPRFVVLLAYPIQNVDEVRQRIVGTHDIPVPAPAAVAKSAD